MEYLIYILECPVTKSIRYVGSTACGLETRLMRHMYEKSNPEKTKWIKWLIEQNQKPIIREIDKCEYGSHTKLEKEYIKKYASNGEPLLNIFWNDGKEIKPKKYTELIHKPEIKIIRNVDSRIYYNTARSHVYQSLSQLNVGDGFEVDAKDIDNYLMGCRYACKHQPRFNGWKVSRVKTANGFIIKRTA